MKSYTLFGLMLCLLVIPLASADIITPTTTKVYFEKGGQQYNSNVDFNVTCWGYSWEPGPPIEKEPGTYTPEKVFSFSANVENYGDAISENYYMNYRHIDYCDIEGRTKDGKFEIKNYPGFPVNFSECSNGGGFGFERSCSLRLEINPEFNSPQPEPIKKGFWGSIACFFRGLFGKSC